MNSIHIRFFKIPIQIYNLRLPCAELSILIYLCSLSGNAIVYPSKKTIATKVGLGKRTVDRAIKSLVAKGYLEYNRGFKKDNIQLCNQYRICMEKIDSACFEKSPKQIDSEMLIEVEYPDIIKEFFIEKESEFNT